ncbi:unnamed protein product [Brassicogethes aeneus]|uniref:Fumarylacetoacetase-like C-terminal domain-containing protein n=1 Tax=Brassicogethes aeneus TaxID=1431903 RepID=A0A9P0BHN7_BRAAE|nr:unnamed protein product [Brassicogethes aeneus]
MRLVQFRVKDLINQVGILVGDNVIGVGSGHLVDILAKENALEDIQKLAAESKDVYPKSQIQLLPPITRPDKILGVAANYKDFCDKTNTPYPVEPIAFSKFSSAIVGPNDPVNISASSDSVDWEVELVAVIGKKGKNISCTDAFDYIVGYTACQDLTEKKWIKRNGGQFLMCKNFDDFLPLGPCLVTKDEINDPHNVTLKTWVNGELKQSGNTADMIHGVDKLVEYFSSVMTLLPGDIILTGTPYGVATNHNPVQFLKKGDILESEVGNVGKLINHVL